MNHNGADCKLNSAKLQRSAERPQTTCHMLLQRRALWEYVVVIMSSLTISPLISRLYRTFFTLSTIKALSHSVMSSGSFVMLATVV